MKLFEYSINGEKVEFVCECKKTRNGFEHDATVFVNGHEVASATCRYLNRTWESYEYQTVCLKAAEKGLERNMRQSKIDFMTQNEYRKMTAKRQYEFIDWLNENADKFTRFWCEVMNVVDRSDMTPGHYAYMVL